MTRHHHRPANPAATFVPFQASPWLEAPALEAIKRNGEFCGKAFQALSEEAVRFTTARLERDGEFGRQLAACRNWTDAAALQRDWMATAAQDYVEETSRVLQLIADFGTRMMQPEQVAPASAPTAGEARTAA